MGEAKRRGSKEQRVSLVTERAFALERAEIEEDHKVSERWWKMSQAERDQHLEDAKNDIVQHQEMINLFGDDVGTIMHNVLLRKK